MKEKKENAQKGNAVKVNDAVTAFRLINPAKLTKMETAERFAVILATRQLKKVATDFDELVKDVQEKLKPEGFDKIVEKVQGKKELTAQEQEALNKYNKDVTDCVQTELDKEVKLDFTSMTGEAMERFIDSNDFTVSDVMLIMDVLGNE
ncbi:MAG: hypothetical protein K2L45_03325 [Muribaculaceae bacterium]|nr:hypothetical protein [Muribaculaceae bacterium]